MTDFIHEQPKEPSKEPKTPSYVPPQSEKERQKKVYAYVGILFLVAALLIAWSFLMTHRSNQQVLSELKESSYTLQSIIDENAALEEELSKTKAQLEEALAESAAYEEAGERAAAALCAMDWLREIEREYGAGHLKNARTLVKGFEDNALAQYLPAAPLHTNPDGNDADSPAEAYRSIVEALFPDGVIS